MQREHWEIVGTQIKGRASVPGRGSGEIEVEGVIV